MRTPTTPEDQSNVKKQGNNAHAEVGKHTGLSKGQQQERKQRVLTQGTPSVVRNIADAVVIKEEDLYFLAQPDGNVPMKQGHGYGLYYHDCRYLNGYELTLAGTRASSLVADAGKGYMAAFQLTNPDIRMKDKTLLQKEQVGLEWVRLVDGDKLTLEDLITFRNFSLQDSRFPITLQFRAEFEDVFAVRGLLPEKLGKLRKPAWRDGALVFGYDGDDGIYRAVTIHFSEKPGKTDGDDNTTVHFDIKLQGRESKQFLVSLSLTESEKSDDTATPPERRYRPDMKAIESALHASTQEWLGNHAEVTTDSLLLNSIIDRSLRDLRMLRSNLRGDEYFAAGLPWFGTLFGRDSIIAGMQTLAYQPEVAEQTLRLLAKYQGREVNDWKDEQPGKILHELRVGEMARLGEIPHSPYYGSIDSTLLFLVLLGQHADWTGDLTLFNDLRDNVEAALNWMSNYADTTGDGYIDYESTSGKGLVNQGWKDSGDAIVNADGSLARPPIALVEVQGYAYQAKLYAAGLFRRVGDGERAAALEKEANDLRARFNRDFWLEDKGFYALALQADGEPCAVLSSNPGQAVWTGITDEDKAARTIQGLMSEEMFTGWGIRTLSSKTRRYNPIAYHLGTVWPHDNSIIAAGFRRYGADEPARRVCTGIAEAAMYFSHYRLPELFAGFSQSDYAVPVHYPVACHPQAWAAGSVPYIITTLLGLAPEGFDNRLRVVRPTLPAFVSRLEMHKLRVGKGTADLRFTRRARGDEKVDVEVLGTRGQLQVEIEG